MSIKSTNGLFAAVSEIDFECRIENRFSITLIRFTSLLQSPLECRFNVLGEYSRGRGVRSQEAKNRRGEGGRSGSSVPLMATTFA